MNLNDRRSFLKGAAAALTGGFGLPRLATALQEATSPYKRPKLKITDVKTTYLQNFHVRIHPAERLARWKQYVEEGDIIQKGHITVPDRPGIGLTLNEEAMKKMVRPGSAWFTA